jgi:hypothetical protein
MPEREASLPCPPSQRFIVVEIDRAKFARVCSSQARAMQILAALAHGRPTDARQLRAFGIRYCCGRLDQDHVEDDGIETGSWDWGA